MVAEEDTFDLHVKGFAGPIRTKLTRDEVGRLKVIARELHGENNVLVLLSGRRITQDPSVTLRIVVVHHVHHGQAREQLEMLQQELAEARTAQSRPHMVTEDELR